MIKNKLIKLEANFDNVIWGRGKEYYKEGLIGKVYKTKDIITAESYGNTTYNLKIDTKKK